MHTRSLGKSGLTVNEVGVGTWSLSGEGYGPVTPEAARATLVAALDAGCTFIETAACYAEGRTEELIGDVLQERGRDAAFVSTRVGVERGREMVRRDFSPKYLVMACERSLKRLKTDHLDAMVLHNPQALTLMRPETWRALTALKAAGKTRLVGVSVGSVEQGEAAVHAGADLLVLPYNLLFQSLLHRLSAVIASARVAVVARSPYAYGLLADTWSASRRFRDDDHRMYRWSTADLARRIRQREALRPMLKGEVTSLRSLALRYVLANGLVSVVVPGARIPEHASGNAQGADTLPYLQEHELSTLAQLLASAGVAA